jgi:hypothetical protein
MWRLFAADARASGLEPRAWVRLPAPLRAALAGTVLAGAASLGALGDQPFVATTLLLLSMILSAARPPRMGPAPRGPGRWLVLTDEEAFQRRANRFRGRFLDVGDRRGLLVFLLLLSGFLVAAAALAGWSAYSALAMLMGSASLLPIFMTGRSANLPVDRVHGAQPLLLGLSRALRKRRGFRAVPWARIPEGQRDPDELRLLVRTPRLLDGVLAIEIGVEHLASLGGFFAQPFVLVRVREDSPAERALSSSVHWQRGRHPEERVAITKSPLPTLGPAQAVVLELIARLSDAPAPPARRTRPASVTPRLAIPSPAHTT